MTLPPLHIRATWDDEAAVWCVSSDYLPGLNVEAVRFTEIKVKVRAALGDLAEFDRYIAAVIDRPLVIVANWPHGTDDRTSPT